MAMLVHSSCHIALSGIVHHPPVGLKQGENEIEIPKVKNEWNKNLVSRDGTTASCIIVLASQ